MSRLIIFAALVIVIAGCSPDGNDQQRKSDKVADSLPLKAPAPKPPEIWHYRESTDQMTDKPSKSACTVSTNEAQLSSPYHNTRADLCIRKDPKYGLDVYVRLHSNGQILCMSYEGCNVDVRFDDHSKHAMLGVSSSDGSTDVIFLRSAKTFVDRTLKSSRVLIQLKFYQDGDQTLVFETQGLKWP